MKKNNTHSVGLVIVRYFVSGAMAILPLVITVAIVTWIAGILIGFIGPDSMVGRILSGLGLRVF